MTRRYINDNGMIKHITLGIVTAPPWTAVPSGSINKNYLNFGLGYLIQNNIIIYIIWHINNNYFTTIIYVV